MVRPARNKKPVNYSQFEDSGGDSDDDFISSTMPRNKKPKTVPKELKQDKPKPSLKNLQKEDILPEKAPKKRVALDDKVFQRGLEVALALSVKELPTVTNQVQKSQEKSTDEHSNRKAEITEESPPVSNCSGTSDNSDLDKVVEEGDTSIVEGEEKASSKATAQRPRQRRAISEGSDSSSGADDAEPDSAADEDSENDSNFDESEESDEEFAVRKRKVKETKKKAVQRKPAVGKEKKSKHKCEASVTSVDMAPAAVKSDSPSLPEADGLSSEASRKSAKMCSPSAEGKRPKWVPPAASGSRSSSSSPLAGAPTKSPSQSLRLGLSRLAPVKRLHPNATSSQVR
ncbi:RAD51-associated protein 1 isoform X2 [Peromyscus californicus insignis]|uniref:RAD51-associated protein 1 isoform X2 n=1 Tax=Peromyscus californicus insignis TaxID=564181 RepID=UPI0022A79003|nr:RAD51-associated protein 1 isoform X2 [Peromyscus californicus insignis]